MSFNTSGTYTNIAGATTAAAGAVIQSATWNAIFTDLATALTQTMSQLIATQSTQNNICFGNGGLEVWQRGTSIAVAASTTAYTADRWYATTNANQACVIAQATGLVSQSQFAAKFQLNAGQTGTGVLVFAYPLDTSSIIPMLGKKMALSFQVKAGTNFSAANGTLSYALYVGTGAVAKRGAGYTSETTPISSTVNLVAGAVTAVSNIGTVTTATTSTQAELRFFWTPAPGAGAGADDSITIDNVQLQVQQTTTTWTATNFDYCPLSICLLDCMRYYTKTFEYATTPAQAAAIPGAITVISSAAARCGMYWRFAQEMRTSPVITTYNPQGANANWQDITGAVTLAVSSTATSTRGIFFYSATAGAADRLIYIQAQADASI